MKAAYLPLLGMRGRMVVIAGRQAQWRRGRESAKAACPCGDTCACQNGSKGAKEEMPERGALAQPGSPGRNNLERMPNRTFAR